MLYYIKSSLIVFTMMMWIHLGIFLFLGFCPIQECNGKEVVISANDSINVKLLELENEIQQLKECSCGCEQRVKDINTLKETTRQTEAVVNELRNELLELSRRPNIAFRSVLSKNLGEVKTGTVIVFDQVDLNSGDAYNPHNGIFTAPSNGTYIFSMSIGNPAGNPGAFSLVQSSGNESVVLEYTIAGNTTGTGWNVGSVTTITKLIAGESVWVKGEGKIHGTNKDHTYYTTFSGTKLN